MFGHPRKSKAADPQKTIGSLLTCPDDQFVERFSNLWDSLKDENGNMYLYVTQSDLITADKIHVSKLTAEKMVVPDKTM